MREQIAEFLEKYHVPVFAVIAALALVLLGLVVVVKG